MKPVSPRCLPEATTSPHGRAHPVNHCTECAARVLSFCSAVGDDDVDRLAAITTSVTAQAHQRFVAEGDPAEHLFNVTAGMVKVYKLMPDGRQQITGFLFPGDFLGLSANERYAYSAESVTLVTYCRFPRRKLEQLLMDFPAVERRLLGIASNELAAAQDQMPLLGRKTALEKVASLLVMLSHRRERAGFPANPVRLPMSRADIADYLGLTVETVSRVMTQLRKSGAIQLPTADEARIANRERLEEMAEGL